MFSPLLSCLSQVTRPRGEALLPSLTTQFYNFRIWKGGKYTDEMRLKHFLNDDIFKNKIVVRVVGHQKLRMNHILVLSAMRFLILILLAHSSSKSTPQCITDTASLHTVRTDNISRGGLKKNNVSNSPLTIIGNLFLL